MSETITLHFSPKHANAMLRKGSCQLDIKHLMGEAGEPLQVVVHKTVATRLRKAVRNGKAVRVYSHEIIPLEGGGKFIDFFKNLGQKIKEGYEKIRPVVAPLLKEGVSKLADLGISQISPYLPSQVSQLIQENKGKAVDALGSVSGAYGMRGGAMPMPMVSSGQAMPCVSCGSVPVFGGAMVPNRGSMTSGLSVYRPQPWSNWSTQAMPLSPAMTSKVAYPGWGFQANFDGLGANGFRVV